MFMLVVNEVYLKFKQLFQVRVNGALRFFIIFFLIYFHPFFKVIKYLNSFKWMK